MSECPDYPDYCKCSDTLQRGAERLAEIMTPRPTSIITDPERAAKQLAFDEAGRKKYRVPQFAELIAADPGIQALVEFAERWAAANEAPADRSAWSKRAATALSKWEQGDG